ncbi:transglutaminase domain-containing protein, partial [Candidatus Woesearchaeota archaeon]|nr:transglutaminase domain-containing protein [Candidatus Woesearchaeota archaeon]
MKKLVMFLLVLILMPSVFADWFYNSRNIVVDIKISSSAEVVPLTPSGYIESATINMTFFPKQTDTQELLRFYTNPKAELEENQLKFTWKRPEGRIDYEVNVEVKTSNAMHEIRQKIGFPIQEIPEDIIPYTKPSETIDSGNDAIIRLASELVKGEDDLYAAVFKIADWTKNNIEYNLSTLTAEVSQKASWVLENRQGVCDELTSLFIALLRAVGIPARFVSGLSYTNSDLFPEKWGPHGWAEVYFPGYGWVPFDVTYGEFGWIDPTHIKFKESVDSDEPSTYYSWVGRNADLKTRKLDIKGNTIEKTGYYRTALKIEASAFKGAVSFGSYNLIEAAIENPNDFYYATELQLSKPKEVKIIGNELKSILLLPNEKKKVFWALKLDDNLDKKYSYTFPLVVSTVNNISAETSFAASSREDYASFEEVGQAAKLLEEEKEKKYSSNVVLECTASKEEFYEYEEAEVFCNAKNTGNVFLEDVDVCFEDECQKISLGISQLKNVTFSIDESKIGSREIPVTLRNELVSKASYVNFKVNDIPKIEIENLEFPANVSYDGNFSVSFTLTKKSQSNPKDVEVVFAQNGITKKWSINELTENQKFVLSFEGKRLKYGKNDYKINVDYLDGLKKSYSAN